MASVTPPQLHKMITESFNLQELMMLCFSLDIVFENLGGEGLSGKALSLVQYTQRHGQYNHLVQQVQEKRAQAEKNMVSDVSSATEPVNVSQPMTPTSSTVYNFHGNVTGANFGGGTITADNIAGGDIIHNYSEPKDKAEFAEQLKQLEALLQQAIASGEIEDERDAESAVEDVQAAIEEVKHDKPRPSRLTRYLEGAKEVIESASKTGAAVLKAVPVISGLIKVVSTIF